MRTDTCRFLSRFAPSILACLILAVKNCGAEQSSRATNIVTFESFLRTAPIIASAQFQLQLPPPSQTSIDALKRMAQQDKATIGNPDSITDAPRVVNCSAKYDSGSFLLNRSGNYGGRLGNLEWFLIGDGLRLFDTSLNRPDNSWSMQIKMASTPVRRLINLGIEEMIPGTVMWERGSDHFTARASKDSFSTDGNDSGVIQVRLSYSNGLPREAMVTQTGQDETVITYKYDSSFFDGQLPVEFISAKPLRGSTAKIKLTIQSLVLSPVALTSAELDPREILKGKYHQLFVVSNNVPNSVAKNGGLHPVLTPTEFVK